MTKPESGDADQKKGRVVIVLKFAHPQQTY